MNAPTTTEPSRVALEDATSFARERLNRYRIELKTSSVFTWLREQWEEERERLRRDLETCARKDLDTLQISISVLGRVLARSSVEAFEKDLEGAVTALREYDGRFPLFPGPTAKAAAQEPAPVSDEEADLEIDDAAPLPASGIVLGPDEADWVTGEAAAALRDLDMDAAQHELDTAVIGWTIGRPGRSVDEDNGELPVLSVKLTALCSSKDHELLGSVSAPDLKTLLERAIQADMEIEPERKAIASKRSKKGAAKRERARKAARS